MPTIYELADAQRGKIMQGDADAKARLIDAYAVVDKDLQRRLTALCDLMEARRANGDEVSRAWLLREARFEALLAQVEHETRSLASMTADVTTKQVQTNLVSGFHDADALIQATSSGQASVATDFNRLNSRATANIAAYLDTSSPFGQLMGRITAEMTADAVATAKNVLLVGVSTGQGPRVIAHNFRAATGESLTRSLTFSRTEGLRAYRQAALQTYQDSETVTAYQWLSTKSARSCVACIAQDGRIYPKDAPFPAHVRCRCTVVPVVGQPRPRETAEDWLRAQDAETQDKIMGPAAAKAWRAGEVELRDFVGMRNSKDWGDSVFHDSLKGARERASDRTKSGTIKVGNDRRNGAKDAGSGQGNPVKESRRLELEALAKKELDAIAPLVSDVVGLKSNWSGRVIVDATTNSRGTKPFECDIRMAASVMETGERGRTYIHEMLHAHSAGYVEADFRAGMGWEEGVVEQLQRLIRKRVLDGLPDEMRSAFTLPDNSPVEREHIYNIYIAALEDLRSTLNADAETFYSELLAVPIGRRSANVLIQRVAKQSGANRDAAKEAYMKASAVLKRNLNNESTANPLSIKAEAEEAARKLFGED